MEIGRHFPSTNLNLPILTLCPSASGFSQIALMMPGRYVLLFLCALNYNIQFRVRSTGYSFNVGSFTSCRHRTRSEHRGRTHRRLQREGARLCHRQGIVLIFLYNCYAIMPTFSFWVHIPCLLFARRPLFLGSNSNLWHNSLISSCQSWQEKQDLQHPTWVMGWPT